MYLVSCILIAALALGSAAAVAWAVVALGRRRRRTADAWSCGRGLPPELAELHYELLVARTELREAIGTPFARTIDLRPVDLRPVDVTGGEPEDKWCGGDEGLDAWWNLDDELAVDASRTHLEQLWRRHGDVLGSPLEPRWHLRGCLDWVQLGPLGRQVVHVRATSGHDAGRWAAIRAHRVADGARFGFGGGRIPIGGTIRAADRDELLHVVRAALSGPEAFPCWADGRGSSLRLEGDRRGGGKGRWRVTDVVEVASCGWLDASPPGRPGVIPDRSSDGPCA